MTGTKHAPTPKVYTLWKCDDGTYDVLVDGDITLQNVSAERIFRACNTHAEAHKALDELVKRVTEYHGYEEEGGDPMSDAIISARATLARMASEAPTCIDADDPMSVAIGIANQVAGRETDSSAANVDARAAPGIVDEVRTVLANHIRRIDNLHTTHGVKLEPLRALLAKIGGAK